jgi:m7GpppX diphosphatase
MLHYIDKEQNKKYTFVIDSRWIDNLEKQEQIFNNDVYSKYKSTLSNVSGELIECSDLTKLDGFCKKIVRETFQDYLDFISQRDFKKEQWVYNILDGKSEQEKILYRDDNIIILPNYTWKYSPVNLSNPNIPIDLSQMYLLTFPTDKTLHSLRDLNHTHLELLEHIQNQTLKVIKNIFGFDPDIIKLFIHYSPTTYHLHIHSVLISNINVNSSVEYSHNLSTIITNIKIKNDYYQSVILDKRI